MIKKIATSQGFVPLLIVSYLIQSTMAYFAVNIVTDLFNLVGVMTKSSDIILLLIGVAVFDAFLGFSILVIKLVGEFIAN